MSDPLYPVHAAITVVPDGSDANAMRLCLRVAPVRPKAGADPATQPPLVDLARWPATVAAIATRFRIDVANITGETGVNGMTAVGSFKPDVTGVAPDAMALWQATFSDDQLKALWNALAAPESDPGAYAGHAVASPRIAPRLDSGALGNALVRSYVEGALDTADRLLGKRERRASAAPPAGLHAPITELEAWAVPGSARDALGRMRDRALRRAEADRVKQAVSECLTGYKGPAPMWRHTDSHAMLDAIHNAEMLSGRFDARLDAAVKASAPRTPIELLAARMDALVLAASEIDTSGWGDETPVPGENERRKLAAILNYSTIAKYLGMAFDVAIPRSAGPKALDGNWNDAAAKLADPRHGAVTARFDTGHPLTAAIWTAFHDHRPAPGAPEPPYFGPCDIAEALGRGGANQKYVRGMLNLGARLADGTPRYELLAVDPLNGALRKRAHAGEALHAQRLGSDTAPEHPELANRGLALIDNARVQDDTDAQTREQTVANATTKLLFADDLSAGYRPAVGIPLKKPKEKNPLQVPAARWRSLVARSIAFGSGIAPSFVSTYYNADRENGHTRSPLGQQSQQVRQPLEMFVWTGESLAAPPPREGEPSDLVADAEKDLPIGTIVDIPAKGLPPLREGRRYVVGMSAMFLNGCGPRMGEALAAHATGGAHLLGDTDGKPFLFGRAERVPAPVLLLPEDSPLVGASSLDQYPGETLTTLVVRGGGAPAQRYLYPARMPFDRAEQTGMFDAVEQDTPQGAFRLVGAQRNRESGDFARAIDGGIDAELTPSTSSEGTRGPVLVFEAPNASHVQHEYYPDNHSRGVWTRFRTVIPSNGAVTEMKDPVRYRDSAAAVDALPVMLALKGAAGSGKLRGRIDTGDAVSPHRPGGVGLRKLSIALVPATAVELELDSDFDAEQLLATHFVAQQLAVSWGVSSDEAAARLKAMKKAGRIDALQGVTRLRLVHAVQRPLKPPRDLGIAPVLLTVAADDGGAVPNPGSWRARIANGTPASEQGGATCFFVGPTSIDAPSTATMAFDARWDEWGPEMVRHDPKANPPWSWVQSKQFARLFTLDRIDSAVTRPRDGDPDPLDLVGPRDKPFGLSFTFRDGRARRLRTRLRAVSRFSEYYARKGATLDEMDVAGHCEMLAAEHRELWIPCTFRPAPPEVRRITPWFHYTTSGESGDQQFDFARRTTYRVEMDRNCFRSGEEERIAVVFNNESPAVCDYAGELLRPFASGVTRWGRDPLHDSPVAEANLRPARFAPDFAAASPLKLLAPADPVTGGGSTSAASIKVTALPYEIKPDPGTGEFYCDIRLNDVEPANDSYMPFVQLGLATYQPHGLPDLELSLPVGHTVQLLPRRAGFVRFRSRGEGFRFELQLRGPVERDPNRGTLIDITALQRLEQDREVARWIPQKHDGALVQKLGIAPDSADGWRIPEFRMAYNRRRYHLGLLVEEYEPLIDKDGKIERRVVFGHIIDFGEPAPPFPTGSAAGPVATTTEE